MFNLWLINTKSVKIICENQRRISVISVLIFIRIGEPPLVSPVF